MTEKSHCEEEVISLFAIVSIFFFLLKCAFQEYNEATVQSFSKRLFLPFCPNWSHFFFSDTVGGVMSFLCLVHLLPLFIL